MCRFFLVSVMLLTIIGGTAQGELRQVLMMGGHSYDADKVISLPKGVYYVCEPNPFKPYVISMTTPGKVSFLRDQVPDHIHHHGLMFAIAVDGVDFWAETEKCGYQKPQGNPVIIPAAGDCLGGFTQRLVWMGEKALLNEERTLKLYQAKEPTVNLLLWESKLSVPEGKDKAELTGSHYFGLGMRLPEGMDVVTKFFNSEGAEGEIVRGDERNFIAKWNAATGSVKDEPVTVAMLSHPDNVRPATWFTMAKGFAYQAATLNLHKQPLTMEAGKPLTLKYAVAAFDGEQSRETVDNVYQKYLTLAGAE